MSAGLVFRAVRFWELLASPVLRTRRLVAGGVPTASRFVFSSVMANSVLLRLGKDAVGDFKVGVDVEDIVAVVESITEPENLGGGSCVFDGDGRFRDVGESLGVGFERGLPQSFGDGVELIRRSYDDVVFPIICEVLGARVGDELE